MTKKALIVLSSPRKGSNSNALAVAAGEGLKEAGVDVGLVDLAGLEIKPCLACEACQRNGGKCSQMDAMQAVYPKIIAADILVLSTPVYFFNVSGQLKTFLDRCFAVATSSDNRFAEKTIALALAFGGGDIFSSGGVNAIRSIQDTCTFCGARWGGVIHARATERDALANDAEIMARARELGAKLAR